MSSVRRLLFRFAEVCVLSEFLAFVAFVALCGGCLSEVYGQRRQNVLHIITWRQLWESVVWVPLNAMMMEVWVLVGRLSGGHIQTGTWANSSSG